MTENGRSHVNASGSGGRARSSLFYRSQTFVQERFALNLSIPNLRQLSKILKDCGLLDKSLKAFCMSPLNNFDYSELSLKSYSKKLVQHLTNLHPSATTAHFRVEFAIEEGLAQTRYDNTAVRVTVLYSVKGQEKTFYKGLLLSWNCLRPAPYDGCVHLPLVLCSGLKTGRDLVHAMLAKCFDCVISNLTIDHKDLICLYIAATNKFQPSRRNQWLELYYEVPGPPSSDEIILSLSIERQKELWHSIVNADRTNIDMREVEMYYKCMMKHVLRTYGLNVGSLRLLKFRLPTAMVSADGKVKVKTPEAAVVVLNLLSDVSTRLESARTSMSQLELS